MFRRLLLRSSAGPSTAAPSGGDQQPETGAVRAENTEHQLEHSFTHSIASDKPPAAIGALQHNT